MIQMRMKGKNGPVKLVICCVRGYLQIDCAFRDRHNKSLVIITWRLSKVFHSCGSSNIISYSMESFRRATGRNHADIPYTGRLPSHRSASLFNMYFVQEMLCVALNSFL